MKNILPDFNNLWELSKKSIGQNIHTLNQDIHFYIESIREKTRNLPYGSLDLLQKIISDNTISAEEVDQIRDLIYIGGLPGDSEINFLFEIHDIVATNENAPEWKIFFIDEILTFAEPEDDPNQELRKVRLKLLRHFLNRTVKREGQMSDTEQELIIPLYYSEEAASQTQIEEITRSLMNAVVRDNDIDCVEMVFLKEYIFNKDTLTDEELALLFTINRSLTKEPVNAEWGSFFIESATKYLTGPEMNFSLVAPEKVQFLSSQLENTVKTAGHLSKTEKELTDQLKNQSITLF